MKFCPVVPPSLIHMLLPISEDVGYFAFAPWLNKDLKYECYFEERQLGSPLTIDCPIYEGYEPLSPTELRSLEHRFKPTFIIVPDVRHDMRGTLLLFDKYCSDLNDAATGVLQGTTFAELEQCAVEMIKATHRIAIPKDVAGMFGLPRYEVIRQLFDHGVLPADVQIHLLGGIWPYHDERLCGRDFPQVKSFDTAEAFNAAHAKTSLIHEPPSRPQGFMELHSKVDQRRFRQNIEQVIRWSQ